MHSRDLEFRKIGAIKPHPKNARTHPVKQISRLVESIDQFGFTSPILVDENNVILAGHARWQAAKQAGLKVVPVIVIRDLSEAKKRAYVLADNKIAELAGYDRPALAAELEELSSLLAEDDLDLSLTGFEPAEIDSLFADLVDAETDPADGLPEIAAHPVSRKGDLWVLGNRHRLLCDDARYANYHASCKASRPRWPSPTRPITSAFRRRSVEAAPSTAISQWRPARCHPLPTRNS
jgi:ParB-like chromosome segregation protein Spo0J